MNTFKMQCINYLLVNEWVEGDDYWFVYHDYGHSNYVTVTCDSIGEALDIQLEWDDEGSN